MTFLQLDSLSKSYPGVQALNEVSFQVQQGHVHALVGENGAGKSTLIRILSGAERPDSGHLWLGGALYRPRTPKEALSRGVSTIYQIFNLLPDRTIMHNALLGKEPRRMGVGLRLEAMQQETQRVLASLGAGYLDPQQVVEHLKVGEKQIVEIAKALLNQSRLLIMDEPTAALNQTETGALFKAIERLKAEGVTILYVSHRLEEIFALCDAVTVLRDGAHISTRPIGEVTRDSLVTDMIGRRLESVFPAKQARLPEKSAEVILEVKGLSARAFESVNFTLKRGEVLAVAGLSGCGKTELGKALVGDVRLRGGRIRLHGRPYRPSPWRAVANHMIYLPEDRKADAVVGELSVGRNITLGILRRLSWLGIIRNFRAEREIASQQVEALAIKTPNLHQEVVNLSGGNQQKVALAKALAVGPDVLLLMEPTQGIDVGVKFEIYQFIADQVAAGRAVLLISSELVEVLGLAHRILVMHDGRITAELDGFSATQEDVLRYALGDSAAQVEA